MKKLILRFLAKVSLVSLGCSVVAVSIWFFYSTRSMDSLSLILFLCGVAVIVVGVLLFGGHRDDELTPRDFSAAEAINREDIVYRRHLRHLGESALGVMALAGCLLIALSLIVSAFF